MKKVDIKRVVAVNSNHKRGGSKDLASGASSARGAFDGKGTNGMLVGKVAKKE